MPQKAMANTLLNRIFSVLKVAQRYTFSRNKHPKALDKYQIYAIKHIIIVKKLVCFQKLPYLCTQISK